MVGHIVMVLGLKAPMNQKMSKIPKSRSQPRADQPFMNSYHTPYQCSCAGNWLIFNLNADFGFTAVYVLIQPQRWVDVTACPP